ncbi:glycosyltransferase [Clostridiaceae bacterium 35-E11]
MKTVLILTASTGGGHNQAALALEKNFHHKGYYVEVVDFIKLNHKIIEILFLNGYKLLYSKLPTIYRGLYMVSNHLESRVNLLKCTTKIFEKNVYQLIMDTQPDLIIGTHPFIVKIICMLKEKRKIHLPFISIITDFKAHNIYINRNVDAYITGSKYTSMQMIHSGIEKNKIFDYGIPLKQEFFLNQETLHPNNMVFTILLMGGSLGYKKIEKVLKELTKSHNKLRIFVVCGNNHSLMYKIQTKYKDKYKNKEIIVYGFTEDIPLLMEKSDILISKPGGLTTSEAIAKQLPLMIPYMLPGQEEENAEFLMKSGAAIIVDRIGLIHEEIDRLIQCPKTLMNMRKNMKRLSRTYSLDSIILLSENLMEKYHHAYQLKKA